MKMREGKKQLRARIKYLERCLEISDKNYRALSDTLDALQKQFDNTPKDCKPGRYCRACVHGSVISNITLGRNYGTIYVCQKGDTCKSFAAKSE